MLPIIVELDLYAWINFSRNILNFIPQVLIVSYIGIKAQKDEMWIGRMLVHTFSFLIVLTLSIEMLGSFFIMSFLYPEFIVEIGEKIISLNQDWIVILIIIISLMEIAQYKGLFHKK